MSRPENQCCHNETIWSDSPYSELKSFVSQASLYFPLFLKMKKLLLSLLILCSLTCLSQDSLKVEQIDSVVNTINQSGLIAQKDSIIQNMPDLGLFMKTFISTYFNGNDLKIY